jgi:tRNA (guanine-N7-)-methyltransferase
MARVLRPGGELRIATDDPTYLEWTLCHMAAAGDFDWQARSADDWRQRPADWPQTRYERKARKAGRRCTYLRYLRR